MKKHLKNLLKRKSKEPRSLDEIKREHAQVSHAAGQAQYLVHIHGKELKRLNDQLESLNNEGAERQRLDAETPKQETPKEEVKNV